MTVSRRTMLAGAATAGFGALAGCLGAVVGHDRSTGDSTDGDTEAALRSAVDAVVGKHESVPAPTNELTVRTDALAGVTDHFDRYSLQAATVETYARRQRYEFAGDARVWVALSTYPTATRPSERIAVGRSDVLSDVTERDQRVTIALAVDRVPVRPLFFEAYLVRADRDLQTMQAGDGEKLCESDPFVAVDGRLARVDHETARDTLSKPGYRRTAAEGVYRLHFEGQTSGRAWTVSFVAYKSAYVREKYAERKRRSQYVTDALADGTADAFGAILNAEAEANGFHTRRAKVDFLIDFVQNLPYVPDDVSTGYDDYTKHVVETLVDGGGDCEDTAVMLASLLQSSSFEYDTVLLLFPGHMAVGVYGEGLPGAYYEYGGRRYYYVETTGRGWDLGVVPDEYRTASATVSQV
ncbi:hypothetical protein [Halogranum rubrum]|uniref:Transglutaminase-like domain-containing protein n=1 Tax=Halogranum salarium B-1 TaxID=1210908 RepID=J3A6X3_9EURY|nr:hypothetical protein [Halogranum salarium]EJN61283.1 hypothetical protein HSB1_03240 [Halogranum salarium B-1]